MMPHSIMMPLKKVNLTSTFVCNGQRLDARVDALDKMVFPSKKSFDTISGSGETGDTEIICTDKRGSYDVV